MASESEYIKSLKKVSSRKVSEKEKKQNLSKNKLRFVEKILGKEEVKKSG